MIKHKLLKYGAVVFLAVMSLTYTGCSSNGKDNVTAMPPENTKESVSETAAPENINKDAVQINVNNKNEFQKIRGFGAGYTYYSNYVFIIFFS